MEKWDGRITVAGSSSPEGSTGLSNHLLLISAKFGKAFKLSVCRHVKMVYGEQSFMAFCPPINYEKS
jgi:hypothetical protein